MEYLIYFYFLPMVFILLTLIEQDHEDVDIYKTMIQLSLIPVVNLLVTLVATGVLVYLLLKKVFA